QSGGIRGSPLLRQAYAVGRVLVLYVPPGSRSRLVPVELRVGSVHSQWSGRSGGQAEWCAGRRQNDAGRLEGERSRARHRNESSDRSFLPKEWRFVPAFSRLQQS